MHNSRLEDIKYRALKQHVRRDLSDNIQFSLRNTPVYDERNNLAEFLSPAVRNLSLLGGGAGAVKGLMEPANDEMGQPVSINQRLGNVALNTIGGGLAGAGAGLGYKALKPSLTRAVNNTGDAVRNIPNAIDGVQNPLQKLQSVAEADLAPKAQSQISRTWESTKRRAKRDTARTKRFFTGRGAGIETRQVPLGKTITTKNPVTGETVREFIPDVDRTGNVVTRAVESVNPNAQLDDVATAERLAASITGGAAGTVAGIGGGVVGGAAGTGIGAGLGALAGGIMLPGVGALPGAAVGAKVGGTLGAMAGSTVPMIAGGYQGAKQGFQGIGQRATQDIQRVKNAGTKAKEGFLQAKDWLGFEYENTSYPLRKITTFSSPGYYKTGAMIGGGLGTGLGAIADISSTMNRQQDREEQELNNINSIDNPYLRMGTYQEYTSPEQRSLRAMRNGVDIVGRGALGAAVGGGLGVGLGGLAGNLADSRVPVKKSLLERVYGR